MPYFDAHCGERFKVSEFDEIFSKFWRNMADYAPREYVKDRLSLARSADDYLALYLGHEQTHG